MCEYVLTSKQMARADRVAIEHYGIPGILLMEAAARGITREILDRTVGPVAILAGPGNNGGDGFAAARMLHGMGREVEVLMARPADEYSGDAGTNARIVQQLGIGCELFAAEDGTLRPEAVDVVRRSAVVVDALLGTGVSGKLRPAYGALVDQINSGSYCVVAVDVPTGVDPDTGQMADRAVRADTTVCFAAAKPGLLLEPGCEMVGDLVVEDIGIPEGVIEDVACDGAARTYRRVRSADVLRHLPSRSRTGHKGSYGHVVIVGGSPGFTGAAVMAAEASLRAGAGLVTCAVPRESETAVASRLLEAMTAGFAIEEPGKAMRNLEPLLERSDVIALGPGMGGDSNSARLVHEVIRWADSRPKPSLVVDADGLNAVSGELELFASDTLRDRVVLTPHPGEMARLLACRTEEVLADRCGAVENAADASGAVVALKGAPTITAGPSGQIWINSTGNPGLATGGSGDVLTGIVASLLAQGASAEEATFSGCFLHGAAADLAADTVDVRSMLPRDVLEYISQTLLHLGWK